jgi:outer membrane protein assembly factor BamA
MFSWKKRMPLLVVKEYVNNYFLYERNGSYEHAIIGGPETLRGYRMDRFWGKTAFYNNNELRFITNLRIYLLNAKAGLLAFFDDGRVWIPGEHSNDLHTSYGAGILLAPFRLLPFTITYGISDETRLFRFRINTLFDPFRHMI